MVWLSSFFYIIIIRNNSIAALLLSNVISLKLNVDSTGVPADAFDNADDIACMAVC